MVVVVVRVVRVPAFCLDSFVAWSAYLTRFARVWLGASCIVPKFGAVKLDPCCLHVSKSHVQQRIIAPLT
jgi:hypothetical protein